MTTKDEALKLALEALLGWGKGFPDNWGDLDTEAITAIREALAEQPAQQEPVAWLIWLHGPAGHFDHKQFAELEFERRNKEYPDPDRKLLPLYTSPPASKPWVGLTDEEKSDLWCESTGRDCVNEDTHVFADAIEAKLREKNA